MKAASGGKVARGERLVKALRDNLRRRKSGPREERRAEDIAEATADAARIGQRDGEIERPA